MFPLVLEIKPREVLWKPGLQLGCVLEVSK